MKIIALLLVLCCLGINCYAYEANWTPYQEEEKESEFWTFNNDNIALFTITPASEITFCFKDIHDKEVQVNMSEIFRVLRSINPELVDKIYKEAQK